MASAIMVALESVSFALILILTITYALLPKAKSLKKDWFFHILFLCALGVAFDLIAWTSELHPTPAFIQFAGNFMAQIMTCLSVVAFGYYVVELINEKRPFSAVYGHVVTAINGIAILVSIIAACCGRFFDIVPVPELPGVYYYYSGGFFYDFPLMVNALCLAYLLVLVLINSKYLGRKETIIFAIYCILPLVSGVLEVVVENLYLAYVCTSLSLVILFILLQSRRMNELMLREELLKEISYIDQLTGLMNRRACDRDVDELRRDDTVGVAFCDLNGLKKVNDERGHHDGDQYLKAFAEIIQKHFPHDCIYRISGDEFLVVARNMDPAEFRNGVDGLKQEIAENNNMAAIGAECGMGDNINALVKRAEDKMYIDKKRYYGE